MKLALYVVQPVQNKARADGKPVHMTHFSSRYCELIYLKHSKTPYSL